MFNLGDKAGKVNYLLFLLAAGLLFAGIRFTLIDLYAVQTPYWDDWGIGSFLEYSISSNLSFSDFYQDANEHRMMFNRILTLGLFYANHRQWDPFVSMVANTLIWALIGVFFVRLALRYHHAINTPALLVTLLTLFCLPLSLVNILWGIQTHTYTMILFAVCGCWYSLYKPLSAKWCLGIVSLFAASLTLAGGTFAAISVAAVHFACLVLDSKKRRDNTITAIAALAAGCFGLSLILSQGDTKTMHQTLTLTDAVTTFLKAMSWPNSRWVWPVFISIIPIVWLSFEVAKNRSTPHRLVRFVLSQFLFITLVCIAISYARGAGGLGPARRYFEFMALLPLTSVMAYLLLNIPKAQISRRFIGSLAAGWVALFILSVPWLVYGLKYTLDERAYLKPIQERLVRTYLNTKDSSILSNRPFRHVPFSQPDKFSKALDNMNEADMLPHLLQTPKPIRWSPDYTPALIEGSAFIPNGTFIATKGKFNLKRVGEDVFGSYKPQAGGVNATGRFESLAFKLNRPYASVPVLGYLGYEGLTMKLVDVGSGEEFEVIPREIGSEYAEEWRSVLLPVPRGYYKIVAEDNHKKLWFGFAAPRSVGRISYYTQKLLDHSVWVWGLGVFLMLISIRGSFINLLAKQDPKANV